MVRPGEKVGQLALNVVSGSRAVYICALRSCEAAKPAKVEARGACGARWRAVPLRVEDVWVPLGDDFGISRAAATAATARGRMGNVWGCETA